MKKKVVVTELVLVSMVNSVVAAELETYDVAANEFKLNSDNATELKKK